MTVIDYGLTGGEIRANVLLSQTKQKKRFFVSKVTETHYSHFSLDKQRANSYYILLWERVVFCCCFVL